MPPPRPAFSADPGSTRAECDRRVAVRYLCRADVYYYPLPEGLEVCWRARMQNISRDGLCLHFAQPVAPGTIVGIELQGRAPNPPCFFLARVVHCAEQPDGNVVVGCQFARRLSDAELQPLL
jgi:PilZ domain-containing protein